MVDIKECFFQVKLPPEQQDIFRILWFKENDKENDLEVLKFTVPVGTLH